MSHALSLARNGVGMTSPNPPVGAVLVSNGQAIGEGFHRKAGMPHAEREAFADALKRGNASLLPQSTLYVTLEPCSTSGRTPACTDAILEYGVKRVVYGTQDPNPKHAGAADKLLAIHGIVVEHGVMEEECRRLIRPFTKTIKKQTKAHATNANLIINIFFLRRFTSGEISLSMPMFIFFNFLSFHI